MDKIIFKYVYDTTQFYQRRLYHWIVKFNEIRSCDINWIMFLSNLEYDPYLLTKSLKPSVDWSLPTTMTKYLMHPLSTLLATLAIFPWLWTCLPFCLCQSFFCKPSSPHAFTWVVLVIILLWTQVLLLNDPYLDHPIKLNPPYTEKTLLHFISKANCLKLSYIQVDEFVCLPY